MLYSSVSSSVYTVSCKKVRSETELHQVLIGNGVNVRKRRIGIGLAVNGVNQIETLLICRVIALHQLLCTAIFKVLRVREDKVFVFERLCLLIRVDIWLFGMLISVCWFIRF